ncbi:hypothetical protein MSPP1_004124 [Malassezia sp. CBS 17886]|nr:hypothetical protein MSPP1_004124 [Malassezia sp. CBS 17886]
MAPSATAEQAFLQALLLRRCVPRGDADEMWRRLRGVVCARGAAADGTPPFAHETATESASMDATVAAINADLAPVHLEIRTAHDQTTSSAFLVLVNTKADSLAEVATPYSAVELGFVKGVIETIFTAPADRFSVSSTAALQLATHLPSSLTKRAAAGLLRNLELREWLQLSRTSGHYTLTARALSELDTYIRAEFEEHILVCTACYELVTIDQVEGEV